MFYSFSAIAAFKSSCWFIYCYGEDNVDPVGTVLCPKAFSKATHDVCQNVKTFHLPSEAISSKLSLHYVPHNVLRELTNHDTAITQIEVSKLAHQPNNRLE